jgi:hypothetical protein
MSSSSGFPYDSKIPAAVKQRGIVTNVNIDAGKPVADSFIV